MSLERIKMEKVFGVLFLMVVSGIVTFLASVYIMMDMGARYYGNYEYYGREYGALTWVPVIIGFLAPGVIAGLLWFFSNKDR